MKLLCTIFKKELEGSNCMTDARVSNDDASIRAQINSRKMSFFQWEVVALCTAINMLDGYDVLVMSFAAASVAADWQLDPARLGLLLSAGLVGMAVGSVLLGSLADKMGRKRLVHICLVVVTIGMLASAYSQTQQQLLILRFFTGLGIGGMLATLTTLVSEYASDNRRGLCMGILQSGYPFGALLGGVIAAWLIKSMGWQSLFLFGGAISAILLPVVIFRLPESLDFLSRSADHDAAEARHKIFQKLDLSEPLKTEFVQTDAIALGWKNCFSPAEVRRNTFLIWLCYLTLMFSFYFVVSWTPKLLVDAGLSMSQGISAGAILQAGGLLGALIMGVLGSKFATNKLSAWFFILSVIFILIYGWSGANLALLMVLSGAMGFFLVGAMIGLYTIAPELYDPVSRVTGVGLAIGVGRLGAIAAPFAGGLMLEAQMGVGYIYGAFAAPLIFAALAVRSISLPGSLK